jgi:hypothetical protein
MVTNGDAPVQITAIAMQSANTFLRYSFQAQSERKSKQNELSKKSMSKIANFAVQVTLRKTESETTKQEQFKNSIAETVTTTSRLTLDLKE